MGAMLSPARQNVPLVTGLTLLNRGKVRDTYDLGDSRLLIVASDGISIFDFVLNAMIPIKGAVLNAMSHFWFGMLKAHGFNSHMMAVGAGIDEHLPEPLRGNPELQSGSMVVNRLAMHPVEFIARGCLTGSGFKDYLKSGEVCGHKLPSGLQDGNFLPRILDTPTTKAFEGHDEALSARQIRGQYPEETYQLLSMFQIASTYAYDRGIIVADTKLEFGQSGGGMILVGDEVFTPDSSRFWSKADWEVSRGDQSPKAPPPLDKQLVRAWGLKQEINDRNPENPDDVAFVHGLEVPIDLIEAASQTYRYIFWRLTGHTIEDYLIETLGVQIERPRKRVAVVLGSETDLRYVVPVVKHFRSHIGTGRITAIDVHIVSCHRNPAELQNFAEAGCDGADVVVAAGGKALALPGVLDAWIHKSGRKVPVIGVALGEPNGPRDPTLLAAVLSISELPACPVVMDEVRGNVYVGQAGFREALARIDSGELSPPKPRIKKEAKLNFDIDGI